MTSHDQTYIFTLESEISRCNDKLKQLKENDSFTSETLGDDLTARILGIKWAIKTFNRKSDTVSTEQTTPATSGISLSQDNMTILIGDKTIKRPVVVIQSQRYASLDKVLRGAIERNDYKGVMKRIQELRRKEERAPQQIPVKLPKHKRKKK